MEHTGSELLAAILTPVETSWRTKSTWRWAEPREIAEKLNLSPPVPGILLWAPGYVR